MKRFHVHVAVNDLPKSIKFYSALFATEPSVQKPDYAKWQLDDPRVNFAISQRSEKAGLDHLGIQTEDGAELEDLRVQLAQADVSTLEQKGPPAATPRATSTGPSTRRASPGNPSTRSVQCRSTAKARAAPRAKRRRPAARRREASAKRPLSLHWQLGEVDPRRGLPECKGRGTLPRAQRRQSAGRACEPVCAGAAGNAAHRRG